MLCESKLQYWMFGDDSGDDDDDDNDDDGDGDDDAVVVVVVVVGGGGGGGGGVPNFPELSYSNLPASNFTRSIPYNTLKSQKSQAQKPLQNPGKP